MWILNFHQGERLVFLCLLSVVVYYTIPSYLFDSSYHNLSQITASHLLLPDIVICMHIEILASAACV